MNGLSDKQKALYRRVDEVLHYVWDPIGISDTPEARNKYHGYLPRIFNLLIKGAHQTELAKKTT